MEEIEAAIVAGRYAIALTPLGSQCLPVYQYRTCPAFSVPQSTAGIPAADGLSPCSPTSTKHEA
jgi:hypothetical protein